MYSGEHAEPQGSGILRTIVGLLVMVALVFGLSWALRTFVFQAYEIPSGSMEETIMTGDMVFSEKVSYYLRDVQPGDIVTFQDPEIPGRVLIKRVIAVGGQTVDLVDGKVVVDGVALDVDVSYPFTVPEGRLWVMGDNRTNSQDSRYFGAIKESSVTGHAVLVYWPLQNFGALT